MRWWRRILLLAAALVAPSLGTATVLLLATGEVTETQTDDGKDPAAVALGRKGGLKGGEARAKKLTAEQRSEIAKKAAKARWKPEAGT